MNTVDVGYYSKRGPNHSKFLHVIILLKNFYYFSLPHHTLEVRISSLVQILHQQFNANPSSKMCPCVKTELVRKIVSTGPMWVGPTIY